MKILGCDYDGTLNHGGIHQDKLAAIQRWRTAGNKIGVVSGRGPDLMKYLQTEYNLSLDFLIAFNGGIIVNDKQEEVFKACCESVDLTQLIQDLFLWGCPFAHVNSDKYYLVRREQEGIKSGEYLLQNLTLPPLLYQVSVELKNALEAAEIVKLIAQKYGADLTPLQNERCIDIVPKGVSKAGGLRKLCKIYSVHESDVIVVGDNYNDVDMLKAFTSYAMENGVFEIKKFANFITKSVEDLIKIELKKQA